MRPGLPFVKVVCGVFLGALLDGSYLEADHRIHGLPSHLFGRFGWRPSIACRTSPACTGCTSTHNESRSHPGIKQPIGIILSPLVATVQIDLRQGVGVFIIRTPIRRRHQRVAAPGGRVVQGPTRGDERCTFSPKGDARQTSSAEVALPNAAQPRSGSTQDGATRTPTQMHSMRSLGSGPDSRRYVPVTASGRGQ